MYPKAPSLPNLQTGSILSEEMACFILVCQYELNQLVHGNKALDDFQTAKEGSNTHDVCHHYDQNNLFIDTHMYFSST